MRVLAIVALLALTMGAGSGSDFGGVYALIDKVTFEPNATNPERVQISGTFVLVKYPGTLYDPPRSGYLYLTLPKDPAMVELARKEWLDLKSMTGTGQVVSFGNRHADSVSVRNTNEKPEYPDVYNLAVGVTRLRSDREYDPVKALLEFREADHKTSAK